METRVPVESSTRGGYLQLGSHTVPPPPTADMCSDGSEESLEEVAGSLDGKEFAASPVVGVASELEGHCHWVVELAIRAVSSLATDNTAIVSQCTALQCIPLGVLFVCISLTQ